MTAYIPLTQGRVALVDLEDYAPLMAYRWYVVSGGYVARWQGDGTLVLLHRHLLHPLPHQWVDHRNGNPLDNRRANLRLANPAQNQWNRRPNTGCQYKGVSWHKGVGKWQVRIRAQQRRYFLGYFTDPVVAAQVYDAASRYLHGAYGRLNFPDQLTTETAQALVITALSRAEVRPLLK